MIQNQKREPELYRDFTEKNPNDKWFKNLILLFPDSIFLRLTFFSFFFEKVAHRKSESPWRVTPILLFLSTTDS